MIPNEERGEISWEVGGISCVLTPSFRVIQAIEQRLGGLFQLAQKMGSAEISLTDLAMLIWIAATDGGRQKKPTLDGIGDAMLQAGYAESLTSAVKFLAQPLNGLSGSADADEEAPDADAGKSGDAILAAVE